MKPDGTALKLDMDPTKYSVAQMIAEGGEIRAYYVLLGDAENLINFPQNDPMATVYVRWLFRFILALILTNLWMQQVLCPAVVQRLI